MVKVKVTHPDFGYVLFTEPIPRQEDILNNYEKIVDAVGDNPNDADLGLVVRKMLRKAANEKKKEVRS